MYPDDTDIDEMSDTRLEKREYRKDRPPLIEHALHDSDFTFSWENIPLREEEPGCPCNSSDSSPARELKARLFEATCPQILPATSKSGRVASKNHRGRNRLSRPRLGVFEASQLAQTEPANVPYGASSSSSNGNGSSSQTVSPSSSVSYQDSSIAPQKDGATSPEEFHDAEEESARSATYVDMMTNEHLPAISPPPRYHEALRKFKAPLKPQWNDLIKSLHDDACPHLFPAQPPNKLGQFLYKINIQGYDITTLLDLGASHSFLTRTWATSKGLDLTPIRPPRPVGLFSGQKNYIRHVATTIRVRFGDHIRAWKFYIIDSAPFPAILGADAILAWPIFFSPLDYRIFIIPDLFYADHDTGNLGGVYQYWHSRDAAARANHLTRRYFYEDDDLEGIQVATPTTSEDEAYRAAHAPLPICYMSMERASNLCTPWQRDHVPMIWLHTTDGFSSDSECKEENLLHVHTVTASGVEELSNLADFMESIDEDLRKVVNEFPKLFAPPDRDPPARPVKHYIYVSPDTVPAARRAYPLGDSKRDAMFAQMRELIDKGWVTPSASPWAAPILFVPKDEGKKLRMCVDFRDLNALTKKDAFPLPRLDLLLHKAAKAKIFSKLDLASGFHQIEVFEQHRELTAFILPEAIDGSSLWEWRVMPFGLVNTPSTFQRAMPFALRGCEAFTAVYIDDVLIFSATREEHLEHLQEVFKRLQKEAYHVRLAKCHFLTKEVRFLGHTLTDEGIKAVTTREKDFEIFTPPFESAKKVRSFLGLVMWYKAFIPHISTIAAPLFPLTSAHRKPVWTEEATQAVEALKLAILTAPTLIRFNRDLPTRVTTDASGVGIGAVLEQMVETTWKPVAFWSRKLKDAGEQGILQLIWNGWQSSIQLL